MKNRLNPAAILIFEKLKAHIEKGLNPSMQDIADQVGISQQAVSVNIKKLEQHGYIAKIKLADGMGSKNKYEILKADDESGSQKVTSKHTSKVTLSQGDKRVLVSLLYAREVLEINPTVNQIVELTGNDETPSMSRSGVKYSIRRLKKYGIIEVSADHDGRGFSKANKYKIHFERVPTALDRKVANFMEKTGVTLYENILKACIFYRIGENQNAEYILKSAIRGIDPPESALTPRKDAISGENSNINQKIDPQQCSSETLSQLQTLGGHSGDWPSVVAFLQSIGILTPHKSFYGGIPLDWMQQAWDRALSKGDRPLAYFSGMVKAKARGSDWLDPQDSKKQYRERFKKRLNIIRRDFDLAKCKRSGEVFEIDKNENDFLRLRNAAGAVALVSDFAQLDNYALEAGSLFDQATPPTFDVDLGAPKDNVRNLTEERARLKQLGKRAS